VPEHQQHLEHLLVMLLPAEGHLGLRRYLFRVILLLCTIYTTTDVKKEWKIEDGDGRISQIHYPHTCQVR
jgi:hypothetical protein